MKKYLTIDVGGSSIKYAIVNEQLEISKKESMNVIHKNRNDFVDCLKKIYQKYEHEIAGVAISMAGTINPDNGRIILCGAFDFLRGYTIHELLSGFCKVPISIENDANCAALAEISEGSLKGKREAIVVLLGSSIGGAIIRDGLIYHGKHYSAGEFSLIKTNGEDDGLHNLWRNKNGKNGLLRLVQKHLNSQQIYSGIEIFDMANQGNEKVCAAIHEFTHLLAIQLYNVQAAFDPECIAIGGGISSEPLLFQYLSKNLSDIFQREEMYHLPVTKPNIVPCTFRNDANLIGAYIHHSQRYPVD